MGRRLPTLGPMRSDAGSVGAAAPRPGSLAVLRHRNDPVRHLTVIARDLQARMSAGLVAERGFDSLRPSLGPFLSLVWTEERSITLLARQLGITKQACSQLARLAEEADYIERVPDPDDGRSKLLRLSARGRRLIQQSIGIVRRADRDYARVVGPKAYARFTSAVARLYESINVPTRNDLAYLEKAVRSVGALPLVTFKAQQDLMQATAAHGHSGLKMSHSQILPFVGAPGVRIADLARFHALERRTVGATARELVALGYLRRDLDPDDRRGALLLLTDRGVRLVRDGIVELRKLERRVAKILGRRLLGHFLSVAEQLSTALAPADDLFALSVAGSSVRARSRAKREEGELARLAARLQRELGPRGSMRLAALLQGPTADAVPCLERSDRGAAHDPTQPARSA